MNTRVLAQTKPSSTSAPPVRRNVLQRKYECGGTPGPTGECEECRKKRESKTLQRQTGHPSSLVHEVLRSSGRPLDPEDTGVDGVAFRPRFQSCTST